MISGRQTLSSLEGALTAERGKLSEVEQRIEALNAGVVEQQRADTADFRELAEVRVDLLAGGKLVQHIDQAEQQVIALLETRASAAQEIADRVRGSEKRLKGLEADRAALAEALDRAAGAVDQAQARTQARLDADADYRAQRDSARQMERTAMHAEEKAANSEREKDQKSESYRTDPLFMYLWERNFGLPEYKAGPLVRWLDGKVARLIGFADARANYQRLSEIPQRLREHAEEVKEAADAQFQVLQDLDKTAQAADGIPELEALLKDQQDGLDDLDEGIEAAEAERRTLLEQQAAFASGDDEHTRTAVEYLATELGREDLMALRREALVTPFPDDDRIISRLLERDDERRKLTASIQGLKETLERHRNRLAELESVRTEFKRSRYDRAGSSFSDGALVALMLGNFLNGMLDRRSLWQFLQEQQRYRPQHSDPSFGSGGFGRGTVWGGGIGDLRDLGKIIGRGGFSRGGGRISGGGGSGIGGGGGFRTGGGF